MTRIHGSLGSLNRDDSARPSCHKTSTGISNLAKCSYNEFALFYGSIVLHQTHLSNRLSNKVDARFVLNKCKRYFDESQYSFLEYLIGSKLTNCFTTSNPKILFQNRVIILQRFLRYWMGPMFKASWVILTSKMHNGTLLTKGSRPSELLKASMISRWLGPSFFNSYSWKSRNRKVTTCKITFFSKATKLNNFSTGLSCFQPKRY